VLWHKERAGRAVYPAEMGATEEEAFLTHLAVNRGVGAVTQYQAVNAVLFLHREVLNLELEENAGHEWHSFKTGGGAVGRVCPAKNRAQELRKTSPPDRPAFGA